MECLLPDGYVVSDDFERIDFARVTRLLASTYWSPGIGIDEVIQGARHSAVVVAAYAPDGALVGYARAASDRTRFAYIMDVYVDEAHRRRGIARALVRGIREHPALADVYVWLLTTKDAHPLYQDLGFRPLEHPDYWMEIRLPRKA